MKTASVLAALAAAFALGACSTTDTTAHTNVKPYTSDMCVMTDNKLGTMGPAITKVYKGTEVKFCCAPCVRKFEKDLDRNLSQL